MNNRHEAKSELAAFRIEPPENRQVAVLFKDVSDRKRAEQELQRERDRLRVTLESIGDAVVTTDISGMVTNLNAVAESLTGWKVAEAAGKPLQVVFNIINEQSRAPVDSPAERALREGTVVGLAKPHVAYREGRYRAADRGQRSSDSRRAR